MFSNYEVTAEVLTNDKLTKIFKKRLILVSYLGYSPLSVSTVKPLFWYYCIHLNLHTTHVDRNKY
jgi:hypothetical protein